VQVVAKVYVTVYMQLLFFFARHCRRCRLVLWKRSRLVFIRVLSWQNFCVFLL